MPDSDPPTAEKLGAATRAGIDSLPVEEVQSSSEHIRNAEQILSEITEHAGSLTLRETRTSLALANTHLLAAGAIIRQVSAGLTEYLRDLGLGDIDYSSRVHIPPERKAWDTDYPDYNPPAFTTEWVQTTGVELGASDPASPNDVDFSGRPSFVPEGYRLDEHGRPCNPKGRQGLQDRGDLAKWGPNNAADPVVIANGKILLIRREDSGTWALPGGMVDPGEHVSKTATRELKEEAGIDLQDMEGEVIYEGYVDDPRNTDNAWMETTARLFRLSYTPKPEAGDDAVDARWFDCSSLDALKAEIRQLEGLDESTEPLYASHGDIIGQALQKASSNG